MDIINDTRRKPDDEATRNELADLAAELSSESESEAPAAADAASEEEPADSPRVAGSPSEEARPNPSPPRARSRARAPFPVELRGPPMRTHAPKVGRFKMTAVDKFTLATQGVLFANAPDVHAMCGASVIAQAVHAAARKARGVEMWLVDALFAALGNQWSKGVRVVATVSDEEGEIAYKTMVRQCMLGLPPSSRIHNHTCLFTLTHPPTPNTITAVGHLHHQPRSQRQQQDRNARHGGQGPGHRHRGGGEERIRWGPQECQGSCGA